MHLSSAGSSKEEDVQEDAGMGVVHSGCPEQGQALLLLWQQSSGFPAFFFAGLMPETSFAWNATYRIQRLEGEPCFQKVCPLVIAAALFLV